jgi:FkbM family methyltransferase
MKPQNLSGGNFMKRLFSTAKSPKIVFNYIWLKLRKIDPASVSFSDAKRFFETQKFGNERLFEAIEARVRTAKTVFDIGANSGYFSKGLIERGFTGRIILFEPIPNLISIAVKTLSQYKNDKIFVNSALGERREILNLFVSDDSNIGWNTLVKSKATSTKSVQVSVTPTLEYASLFRPELVKIDIEGFEVFVLRPFLELISPTYRPSFLVELGWGKNNPHWTEFLTVASQLYAQGYKITDLSKEHRVMTLDELRNLEKTIDVLIEA